MHELRKRFKSATTRQTPTINLGGVSLVGVRGVLKRIMCSVCVISFSPFIIFVT